MDRTDEAVRLPWSKRLVVLGTCVLSVVGVFDALENLPVVSGCAFYGECVNEHYRNPPGELGRDLPR